MLPSIGDVRIVCFSRHSNAAARSAIAYPWSQVLALLVGLQCAPLSEGQEGEFPLPSVPQLSILFSIFVLVRHPDSVAHSVTYAVTDARSRLLLDFGTPKLSVIQESDVVNFSVHCPLRGL